MDLTLSDTLMGRQRSRQWCPLVTQQYRLRHIHQILGLNLPHLPAEGVYYYTLHLTTLSAPFYTSEKMDSINPKWPELDLRHLSNLSATRIVLRVWRHCGDSDNVVTTWGINFSGLVHIGSRLADIQCNLFCPNSVIFNIKGTYFTSRTALNEKGGKLPFSEVINITDMGGVKTIYKRASVIAIKSEVRDSYTVSKLRRLQALQVIIRNKTQDVQIVREKLEIRLGPGSPERRSPLPESSRCNIRYAPQLLTMKSVNRMMEQKPTKSQRIEMEKIRNQIEIEQFRSRLLSQERDRKWALMRQVKNKLKDLVDRNEQKNSNLMGDYYQLRRDSESLKQSQKQIASNQILLTSLYNQLQQRRRQLLKQLLSIYPIEQLSENIYTIHGIHVPNSDILSDSSDGGVSVAFGYITHILLMASSFLQVPLRYSMSHHGSRSYVSDHVSSNISERGRDFPLFTKGKERMEFTYAVYLLNKNIAQLRWLFFMNTPELMATLPNLLNFLEGRQYKETQPLVMCPYNLKSEMAEDVNARLPILARKYEKMYKKNECRQGLSEILAIPEVFMNRQMSSESFRSYAAKNHESSSIVIKEGVTELQILDGDNIEQGTDPLEGNENVENSGHLVSNGISTSNSCINHGGDNTVENLATPLLVRTDALINIKSFNLVKSKPNM